MRYLMNVRTAHSSQCVILSWDWLIIELRVHSTSSQALLCAQSDGAIRILTLDRHSGPQIAGGLLRQRSRGVLTVR